jgi:hypothetical protein
MRSSKRSAALPDGVITDTERKRVTCPFPVSLSALPALSKHVESVCGLDAVVDSRVSGRLGVMATCARGGGDAWLAELDAAEAHRVREREYARSRWRQRSG